MLGANLVALTEPDHPGVASALDLVTGVDDALAHGFARLGEQRLAALQALAAVMTVTPLGERVGEAVEKVAAGSIADEHLLALAGARAALLGAVHDCLLARFDTAAGRRRETWAGPATRSGQAPENLFAGSRSWLRELAIAGWRGVDNDLVSAVAQTVQGLLAQPAQRRLAVLLDGLAGELRAASPIATMNRLPTRRWADLWARALLLSRPAAGTEPAPVGGRLLILGVDVHEHATAVQVQVHGVLESGDTARLVRASVVAAKVDTIVGPSIWKLLHRHPVLLHALANHTGVTIADMPLLPSGDLIWDDARAKPDGEADPFTTARLLLPTASAPAVPPLHRHPVAIAEPVLLEGYTVADGPTLRLGGGEIAVAVERLTSCGPVTPELIKASTACIGLLRWDAGRWTVQPVAVQAVVKRATIAFHAGDWALGPTDPKVIKAEAKAGDAVGVLRERAGRLLRT
jgi:hypothetical protein